MMPRTQIQFTRDRVASTGTLDDPGPLAPAPDFPLVHVGWHDGWVQMHLSVDKQFLLDLINEVDPEPDGTVTVYSEVLTRQECNRLIRATRGARDKAYGRDE